MKALRNHFNLQLHWQALLLALYFIMFKLNGIMLKLLSNGLSFRNAVCFSLTFFFVCAVNFKMVNVAFQK